MLNSSLPGMFLPNVIERFAPLTATDYVLPSTGVRVGQVFTVINSTANNSIITVRSSDGAALATVALGMVMLVALQDTPTAASHWVIPYRGFKGRIDGLAPAAGDVGQIITSTAASTTYTATNTFENVTSIALTAGNFYVTGQLANAFNNSTAPTALRLFISGYSGNTNTDILSGFNVFGTTPATSNNSDQFLAVSIPVRCDGTNLYIGAFTIVGTTLYLKSAVNYTGTAPTRSGTLTAYRTA